MNLGEKIKNCRKQAGMTQQQVADKMGVSYQAVSCWENGEYLPDLNKLSNLAAALGISVSELVGEDYRDHWELHDRMFSEDHMYTFIQTAAHTKGFSQTIKALPYAREKHEGQVRKGKDGIPYIYHPLTLACHALALGFEEDEIIAAALLHDVVEDCGVAPEDLPVADEVRKAVSLLSFQVEAGEDKGAAKKRYYHNIADNRIATIVKVLDRCNNISSMANAFSREKMVQYIDETENYIMPLLDAMKYNYPECYNAAFLLKYHMRSVLESLKRVL